jgi:cytochrome P450
MFASGKTHRRIAELHEKYGNIVRVGPDELSYILPEAWDEIMGRRRGGIENPKAPWYCSPDNKDIVGAPYSDHVRMRRVLSPGFSAAAIAQHESLIK